MEQSQRNRLATIAVFGALAVVFGAFGSHALKAHLDPAKINAYNVGVQYHFYHTLAMCFCYLLHKEAKSAWYKDSFTLFAIGILCFSGSLYGISLASYFGFNMPWLGPITPIGGVFFVAAWLMLLARR